MVTMRSDPTFGNRRRRCLGVCLIRRFFVLYFSRSFLLWHDDQVHALQATTSTQQTLTTNRIISLVTGGSGLLGRELIHALLQQQPQQQQDAIVEPSSLSTTANKNSQNQHQVISLVRPSRVSDEQAYWKTICSNGQDDVVVGRHRRVVTVLPYDMMDGGSSLQEALSCATTLQTKRDDNIDVVVYHVASYFRPSDNHVQMALDNVRGTEDVVRTMAQHQQCSLLANNNNNNNLLLVLTSSMAAVRGPGQLPGNGRRAFTCDDWNTVSQLLSGTNNNNNNWGTSYQWSKTESERRAWQLSQDLNVPMVALLPSFIFGPPRRLGHASCQSYSIELVQDWLHGRSPVQSRLCVDVRDVALAHVAAAAAAAASVDRQRATTAAGQRYIVSTDARVPSWELAEALKRIRQEQHDLTTTAISSSSTSASITYDAEFAGGAIPIGEQEVVAEDRLRTELGIELRPVVETISDMGRALLQMQQQQ